MELCKKKTLALKKSVYLHSDKVSVHGRMKVN